MNICVIPGCGGIIVTETKINGSVVDATDLPSGYDTNFTAEVGERSKRIERAYYCERCGVQYHHLPEIRKILSIKK